MRLYLVRHAEASPGEPDELRRLSPHGEEQARHLGDHLAEKGVQPAIVLSSPLLRARQTAQAIAKATGAATEPDDRLAPGAAPDGIVAAASGRGETVVVVGHQPDCGLAYAALTGEERGFAPASVAVVDL